MLPLALLVSFWPTRIDQSRPVIMDALRVSRRAPLAPRDTRGR